MLDEPTAGQDSLQVFRTLSALRGCFSGALLIVTHEIDLAMSLASSIVLEQGECVVQVAPKEFILL